MQKITGVKKDSAAGRLGISPGHTLLSINGEAVIDVVDYTYLTAESRLKLRLKDNDGNEYGAEIRKEACEPLGLEFETGLMSPKRSCKNRCLFCFIDQMPENSRDTLRFKDDDWRLSLIMGNYISLTNVDEAEFTRIIERRVSPLYISVHATDPDTRVKLMRNPQAGLIYERLTRLYEAGLSFHCQIVCCPGINDGEILTNTIRGLYSLRPAALSTAVVPVGLTKFRKGLHPLRVFTPHEAIETLRSIEALAGGFKKECGSAFVFASDEFYLLAGMPLPSYDKYEDFPQIENGVGLLRLFEEDFVSALEEREPLCAPFKFDAAGGMLAMPFFTELYGRLRRFGIDYTLHPVRNDYFGESITVGGLVTGGDILAQLKGRVSTGVLLIPHQMLKEGEDVFLDGMKLGELQKGLGVKVVPVRGDGEEWVNTIFSLANAEEKA